MSKLYVNVTNDGIWLVRTATGQRIHIAEGDVIPTVAEMVEALVKVRVTAALREQLPQAPEPPTKRQISPKEYQRMHATGDMLRMRLAQHLYEKHDIDTAGIPGDRGSNWSSEALVTMHKEEHRSSLDHPYLWSGDPFR